jgi:hypothetical protein
MALVRGRILVPVRASIKEDFGDPGWKRLLAELPPSDRELLDGLILQDNWYERRLHNALIDAAERLFRADNPDVLRRVGARAARHHDKFYLRPLMALGGPMLLVRRASSLHREYFQGSQMAVIEQRDKGARLQLDDPNGSRVFCQETLLGFIEEIVRLSGRTLVHVITPVCRYQGADHCEIDLEWT